MNKEEIWLSFNHSATLMSKEGFFKAYDTIEALNATEEQSKKDRIIRGLREASEFKDVDGEKTVVIELKKAIEILE